MKKVHVNAAISSNIPYYVVHDENNICGFFGHYRWLSNFYACSGIVYDDIQFPSVEHAYQSAKFPKEERFQFLSKTPGQVKKLGYKAKLPQNWDEIKLGIMTELVNLKFQDMDFRRRLFDTGFKHLEERNSWGDVFWGTNENGVGQNHLGKILMEIRSKI